MSNFTTTSRASKPGRLLARLLIPLGLAAALISVPSAAQATGDCGSTTTKFDTRTITQSSSGKTKEVTISCNYGKITLGILMLRVYWDGDTYVQVCDMQADGYGPKLHVRFYSGSVWHYADYRGTADGVICNTHRLDVSDTPKTWKYVTYHQNLRNWNVSWAGDYSPNYEWPLHAV